MKDFKDAFDFERQSRPKNIKKLDNDSFYFEFDKKKKKRLIKMGALSGCFFSQNKTRYYTLHIFLKSITYG